MTKPSNVIDYSSPTANMYGCEPCPKCGGRYRASYNRGGKTFIDCDDCSHTEEASVNDETED